MVTLLDPLAATATTATHALPASKIEARYRQKHKIGPRDPDAELLQQLRDSKRRLERQERHENEKREQRKSMRSEDLEKKRLNKRAKTEHAMRAASPSFDSFASKVDELRCSVSASNKRLKKLGGATWTAAAGSSQLNCGAPAAEMVDLDSE
ncbi:hypothetical protein DFH07DRAFT_766678 [Mycena maculata]|uniref:Uncharacterized protein n=1 Tax=Mycena maculata TaxID=230809 RepID=A0AAD7NUF1_9AGAR|nr:hypothetical protein DFH07DRAFT_766678 [Mycena maculata]